MLKVGSLNFTKVLALILCVITVLFSCPSLFTARAEDDKALPEDRIEFEDAVLHNSMEEVETNVKRRPIKLEDSFASGGATATETWGKFFVFNDVKKESNRVNFAYASENTSNVKLYLRYPGEEKFTEVGLISFSTSNSWSMKTSYIASSPIVYIPEGSDIMIRPNAECNFDYIFFTNDPAAQVDDAAANIITADKISKDSKDDSMAPYGVALELKKGESLELTVPEYTDIYNVLSLSFCSESGAELSLEVNGQPLTDPVSVFATPIRTFKGTGFYTNDYNKNDKIKITCTEGSLFLSHATVDFAEASPECEIKELPTDGDRLTVSLDGIWEICATPFTEWSIPQTVPEDLDFSNTICVPGLWHCAAFDLGDYKNKMTWYKKTVILEQEPDTQALLNIGCAQYGRYIYVNGQLADTYEYNYSASSSDITKYLHKGENEIIIMLGAWSHQFYDRTTPAHVLSDGESPKEEPGITDSVTLVFNRTPHVSAVQTNPDIDNGTVDVKITLDNNTDSAVTTDVKVSFYELGLFTNGVANNPETKVGEYTVKEGLSVDANGNTSFLIEDLKLENWSKDKCWSHKNPYLYRVEIKTAGDTYSVRFGMRVFKFDPETKYATINGEIIYLFGTNVAIERYFDDPLCGDTPWQDEWIRKLYSEFKDVNWFCFRTHLGGANSKWFNIADEMGFMIFDEYALWGDGDHCTTENVVPEFYRWVDTRGNHPSLVVFDAQNEATGAEFLDDAIRLAREYDIQHRPWENGWRRPIEETDPIEAHPYIIGSNGISGLQDMQNEKPIITGANIGWTAQDFPNNPVILNEHIEYWITREGLPTAATHYTWNLAKPTLTTQERKIYFADLATAQVEAFRAGRAYSGLLFFCGLTSSFPDASGVTSDILAPDVSSAETLQIRPYIKELLSNTYADLGIVIETYTENRMAGARTTIPVTLVNDTGKDIKDLEVRLVIKNGDTVIYADRKTMSVDAFSADNNGLSTENFTLNIPTYREYCKRGEVLTVIASYELDGKTVYSQRKWNLLSRDAVLTDDELPTYDWLTETTAPDTTAPSESNTDTSTDISGNNNGGKSYVMPIIIGVVAVVAVATVIVVIKKKK